MDANTEPGAERGEKGTVEFYADERVRLLVGDAEASLSELQNGTVNCCVTSPPYYGLRDYGGEDDQIGLEESPKQYVDRLVGVFAEVRRVLDPAGTLWLNLGDSYSGSWGNQGRKAERGTQRAINAPMMQPVHDGRYPSQGSRTGSTRPGDPPAKNLRMMPYRLALALQDDGWFVRNDVIWWKRNAMPSPIKDRLTNRYEHLFLLTPNPRYEFDLDAIREQLAYPNALGSGSIVGGKNKGTLGGVGATERMRGSSAYGATAYPDGIAPQEAMGATGKRHNEPGRSNPKGKNPGDVWLVDETPADVWDITTRPYPQAHFATFPVDLPTRCIKAGCVEGGVVLDPFSGSGTTGLAAVKMGRSYIGIDLHAEYHELAIERIGPPSLFGKVEVSDG